MNAKDILSEYTDEELSDMAKIVPTIAPVLMINISLGWIVAAGYAVVHKGDLIKKAGLIVAEELLGKEVMKPTKVEALPRWRCVSCRRLYEEYSDAVDCCKKKK